jgi:2-dehydro-3-deoxyphosphogluconate aldolase/(4S)-4-hydroxy-2-oxoglutarate aldolase
MNKNKKMSDILARAPVIPVIVIHKLEHAVPLAEALVAGGLSVLEITLRTPAALAAIEAICEALPEAVVGAGTVRRPEDLAAVAKAGAMFAVSPGLTPALTKAAAESPVPLLPGTATASEVMHALDSGFTYLKFFPAQQAGGVEMLRAFSGPLADAKFCPTGGVTPENAPSYLALPNVVCVGGTWMVRSADVEAGNWTEVTALAATAAGLRRK